MAFIESKDGELSEEVIAENEKYGKLAIMLGEGNSVEGIYRGVKQVTGYQGKGKQSSHTFEDAKTGEEFKIRGFGLMDHIIKKEVTEGDLIRVTYKGKGEDGYHKCSVGIDNGEPAPSEEM